MSLFEYIDILIELLIKIKLVIKNITLMNIIHNPIFSKFLVRASTSGLSYSISSINWKLSRFLIKLSIEYISILSPLSWIEIASKSGLYPRKPINSSPISDEKIFAASSLDK